MQAQIFYSLSDLKTEQESNKMFPFCRTDTDGHGRKLCIRRDAELAGAVSNLKAKMKSFITESTKSASYFKAI